MRDNPRIFFDDILVIGNSLELSREHAHYIHNVLRLNVGDEIIVFNGENGEFLANIIAVNKKSVEISLVEKTRDPENLPNFTLMFAPIKGHRNDNIIEKATEIGIANLQPILTERTIVRKANIDKYRLTTIEAAEQCERLNIPKIFELCDLADVITNYDGIIFFADEAGGGNKIGDALTEKTDKIALLIGPEGGFSTKEREFILSQSNVIPISLGNRILRADTACITGLGIIQSFYGDW